MKKHIRPVTALMMSAAFMATYSEPSRSDDSAEQAIAVDEEKHGFETLNDRYSYAYGADLAKKFQEEGVELNVDIMASAMQDVFGGREKKMSAGEIAATIDVYMKVHEKEKKAERTAAGKVNKEKGEAFLEENASKEDVIVTESGLQYKVLTEGDGKYTPREDDKVTVHYRGTFIDGTEFDSTYKRNEPYSVKIEKLIEGLAEALKLMSEGSKWIVFIPAGLAYGEEGSGEYVEPGAALIFELELLGIEKETD